MNALLRLAAICSALSLATLAAPSQAQQSPSVPPAPPPDVQSSPSVPPPFPPMPTREPRHRFVDMGDHRSSARHRTTRTSHHATHSSRHSTRHSTKSKGHETHARHGSKHSRHEAAPALSKKQIRQCHGMSYRQLLKHSNCAALLQRELKSESHSKRHSHSSKAVKRKKSEHHRTTSRKASTRHHKR
jgi:hypothetical protein